MYILIKKDILILGKGLTPRLDTTLKAEAEHCINFTTQEKNFCLSLQKINQKSTNYNNGSNSNLFLNPILVGLFYGR